MLQMMPSHMAGQVMQWWAREVRNLIPVVSFVGLRMLKQSGTLQILAVYHSSTQHAFFLGHPCWKQLGHQYVEHHPISMVPSPKLWGVPPLPPGWEQAVDPASGKVPLGWQGKVMIQVAITAVGSWHLMSARRSTMPTVRQRKPAGHRHLWT